MLEYQCPHCSEVLAIPEQFVGSTGTCRNCRNPITIETSGAQDAPHRDNVFSLHRPPALIVFHCETTGASTRRHSIIELAGLKIDLAGRASDSFWSFANPEQSIPEKISERTGITDDMVADAPFSLEIVTRWFEWVGPQAILFTNHAQFHARFVCAAMFKQSLAPPSLRIVDVVHWARELSIPVREYKLRPLLEYFSCPYTPGEHRALETCKSIAPLVANLIRRETGPVADDDAGVLSRLLGRNNDDDAVREAYKRIIDRSASLDEICGDNFYVRDAYEERMGIRSSPSAATAADKPGNNHGESGVSQLHMPEWYDKKRHYLQSFLRGEPTDVTPPQVDDPKAEWRRALNEASGTSSTEEQNKLLIKAVSLKAVDPWPYERLMGLYIRAKDYGSARLVCDQYFRTDAWKEPKWVDTSLRLLDKMERLDQKLSELA